MNENSIQNYTENIEYSGEDLMNLNSLPEKEIFLNSASITDLCSNWKSRVNNLNLTSERITSSALRYFSSYGILENYCVSLSTAINSIILTINNINDSINNSKNSQIMVDESYSNNKVINNDYTTNSVNNSYRKANTTVNNNFYNASINSNQMGVNDFNLIDYIGISVVLSKFLSASNSTFFDIVNDDIKIENVKKELLNSINITDELKKSLLNMDISALKQILVKLYSSGNINLINSENIEFLNSYFTKIANINNIDYNSLISNAENQQLLYNNFNYFNNALNYIDSISSDNVFRFREKILNIYEGKNIYNLDSNSVSALKTIIDVVAENNNTSSEQILNGDSRNYLLPIINSKEFFNMFCNLDMENNQKILSNIFYREEIE